jgi:hypothetical protein
MIVVDRPPNVMPVAACPTVRVKVLGRRGYTLRVASYNMLTGSLISESTYAIGSDPWEGLVGWGTPAGVDRGIVLAVLEVRDGSGNIVERWAQPFIYIPNAVITRLDGTYEVAYISKNAMAVKYDKLDTVWLDPMNITIAWKPGRIIIWDGTTKVMDYTGVSAVFELKFRVPRDVAKAFANFVDDPSVASVVYKAPEVADLVGAVAYIKHVVNSFRFTNIGTTISFDSSYVYVTARFYLDLHSFFDWKNILMLLAGIGAVVAGTLIVLATAGVGIPAALWAGAGIFALVSGTAAIVYTASVTEEPQNVMRQADVIINTAINEMNQYKNQLSSYLDQLVSQGKITPDDKNTIMGYADKIINTASKAMQELKGLISSAYEQGKREMYPWIAVSFVGGVLGGMILERAAMPRVAPR